MAKKKRKRKSPPDNSQAAVAQRIKSAEQTVFKGSTSRGLGAKGARLGGRASGSFESGKGR
jgi:hypothetical protein